MGKSLRGEELGTGITQRKDGIYQGSFVAKDGRRVALYSRNLDDVKRKGARLVVTIFMSACGSTSTIWTRFANKLRSLVGGEWYDI